MSTATIHNNTEFGLNTVRAECRRVMERKTMNTDHESVWTASIVVICGALYLLICGALIIRNLFCEG